MILINTAKKAVIYEAIIGLLRVFLWFSNILKIVDVITLNLLNVFLSTDFKTILQTQTSVIILSKRAYFKQLWLLSDAIQVLYREKCNRISKNYLNKE